MTAALVVVMMSITIFIQQAEADCHCAKAYFAGAHECYIWIAARPGFTCSCRMVRNNDTPEGRNDRGNVCIGVEQPCDQVRYKLSPQQVEKCDDPDTSFENCRLFADSDLWNCAGYWGADSERYI